MRGASLADVCCLFDRGSCRHWSRLRDQTVVCKSREVFLGEGVGVMGVLSELISGLSCFLRFVLTSDVYVGVGLFMDVVM